MEMLLLRTKIACTSEFFFFDSADFNLFNFVTRACVSSFGLIILLGIFIFWIWIQVGSFFLHILLAGCQWHNFISLSSTLRILHIYSFFSFSIPFFKGFVSHFLERILLQSLVLLALSFVIIYLYSIGLYTTTIIAFKRFEISH